MVDRNDAMNDYETPDLRSRKWAMACHLGGLAWVPLLSIILPWVIWRMSRHDHPYIDEQGREAINFQISLTIYNLVTGAMIAILSFVFLGWLLAPLAAILFFAEIAGIAFAAYAAYEGRPFRYPLTIRFLS